MHIASAWYLTSMNVVWIYTVERTRVSYTLSGTEEQPAMQILLSLSTDICGCGQIPLWKKINTGMISNIAHVGGLVGFSSFGVRRIYNEDGRHRLPGLLHSMRKSPRRIPRRPKHHPHVRCVRHRESRYAAFPHPSKPIGKASISCLFSRYLSSADYNEVKAFRLSFGTADQAICGSDIDGR